MNIHSGNSLLDHPGNRSARRHGCNGSQRPIFIFVFVIGIFTGYILCLWQQIGQKLQRIEDEKIHAAGNRWKNNMPSVRVDER